MISTDSAIPVAEETVVVPSDVPQSAEANSALEMEIVDGASQRSTRTFSPGRYVVGSDENCDVVIRAGGVQPRHFLMAIGTSRAVLRTYGDAVILNGHPMCEGCLFVGDLLQVGDAQIEVKSASWELTQNEHEEDRGGIMEESLPSPEPMSAAEEAVVVALEVDRAREVAFDRSEQQVSDRAHDLKRRVRRFNEVVELLLGTQCDVVAKARSLRERATALEAHLAAAGLVEEKLAIEGDALAKERRAFEAERENVREGRNEAERVLADAEMRRQGIAVSEAELHKREQAVAVAEEHVRQREVELENLRVANASMQRRLLAEREEVAIERVITASEKTSLEGECAAIEQLRRSIEASQSLLEAEREAFRSVFTADYVSIEETRCLLGERAKELKNAEVECAWREQELSDREERLREREAEIVRREQARAVINSGNVREESTDSTPSEETSMSNQAEEVELPTFDDLPQVDSEHMNDGGEQPSLSALLGVSKVDASSAVMDRLDKVERLLESLLQRLPNEVLAAEDAPQNVKDWRRAFKSPMVEEPKPAVIELDDAHNSGSVANYMEQLLIRMRAGNPVIPAPGTQGEPEAAKDERCDDGKASDNREDAAHDATVEGAVVLNPLPETPTPRPEPRARLTKDELRAQNSSLREVANLSARQAISKHSMTRYKAELTAKAIISIVAFATAVSFFTANVTSGNEYLWQSIAAFIAVVVIVIDFLATVRRFPDTTPRACASAGPAKEMIKQERVETGENCDEPQAELRSDVVQTDAEQATEDGPKTAATEAATVEAVNVGM